MREKKHVTLEFPILGLDKNWAKRSQPERTTIDCANVRGYGEDDRARGGQRPGLSKYNSVQPGGTSARIQALHSVITVPTSAASATNLQQRTLQLVAIVAGKWYLSDSGRAAWNNPVNQATVLNDTTSPYVAMAHHSGKVYACDGYKAIYWDANTGSNGTLYDWPTQVTGAGAGTFPSQAGSPTRYFRLLVNWRGRLVGAGLPGTDAHNWYMSKKDVPLDWDTAPTVITETQAIAGNSANAGDLGEVINCLIPVNDDVLLFGCDASIWQLTGDPMVGGRFDLVSDVTGMAFGEPWCRDNDGNIYFFGSRGHVFVMEKGSRNLKNLSAMRLPRDLSSINLDTNLIRMEWNDDAQGFHLFVVPLSGGIGTHYFYSVRLDAWFKDTFGPDRNPVSTFTIDGDDPNDRFLLLGNEDGYVRKWDEDSVTDDGTAINSYVYMGPYQVEKGTVPFVLSELQATLKADSDDVSYRLYIGNSAEDAGNVTGYLLLQSGGRLLLSGASLSLGAMLLQGLSSESHVDVHTGDFSATRSVVHFPRKRGYAAYIKLFNDDDAETWEMESLRAKLMMITTSKRRQRT